MDIIIQRILFLIKVHSITAHKLTKDLGLSNSAVSEWKKGKARPTSEAVKKIAQYFNVTSDYLLGLTDNAPVPPFLKTGVTVWRNGEKVDYPVPKAKLHHVEKLLKKLTPEDPQTV